MQKHYIIDGNNLLGKIKNKISGVNDPQMYREKLAFLLERYFSTKKVRVTLNFDGHPRDAIKVSKIKIIYSENKPADDLIVHQIETAKNPKHIVVVSSDRKIMEFAKACSCTVLKSEELIPELFPKQISGTEEEIIKEINPEEIKKLFGIK